MGDVTLRYGWRPVAAAACQVATEVARVLTRQGWTGAPRRCSERCVVGEAA
jgi:hypothetical protein